MSLLLDPPPAQCPPAPVAAPRSKRRCAPNRGLVVPQRYAFIPDGGLVGTVFVNAISNVLSTAARQTVVKVRMRGPV